ncbi:hypothetical protein ACFXHA_03750 [Nocardia sp. NPDC059240]|uniref:hypothetical protein n=1 Tax=Nocardia sp. NPDC059240 TaxID=3346786 RepID=UPI003674411E
MGENGNDQRAGEGFLEHVPTVVGSRIGANLGTAGERSTLRDALRRGRRSGRGIWSRADIDGVFKAFGAVPDEAATGDLMHVHPNVVGLIASKTEDHRLRYGYGEYRQLRLVQIVPPEAADPGYRRALAICAERLGAVFGSLAADVPLLHRHTSDVAWTIGAWGEPGFLARGRFSPDGCTVETSIHGQTHVHRLAPGRPSGVEVAELTMGAIEAARLNSPGDLHYTARATQPPRQVTDASFGLRAAPAAPDLDRSAWRGRPKVVHAYIKSETIYDWIDGELHEVSHTDFDPPKRAT